MKVLGMLSISVTIKLYSSEKLIYRFEYYLLLLGTTIKIFAT